LDEIGRGTRTYDCLAIARAVVEHLHNVTGARTLFATHYHELASMADELPHLRVYTMQISDDEQGEIVFLHRVTPGCIGRSYGVHVAKLAGMPPSIVRRANEVLKQLETGKHAHATIDFNGNQKMVAEGNGRYYVGGNGQHTVGAARSAHQFIAPDGKPDNAFIHNYKWQSEAAHLVA